VSDDRNARVALMSVGLPRASPEPLQPQELVITLFGAFASHKHECVWSGGLVDLLNGMGFSDAASRVALTRLVNRGLLKRTKKGRLVYYTPAPRLDRLLAEGDRRIFRLGSTADGWDGHWTMLWHAIPETLRLERGRLARRLRFLGFGSVQDATWISPHNRERDVVELLEDMGVEEHACVLIGRPAKGLDLQAMINRAWDLEDLATRYESFVETFGKYRSAEARAELSDRDAFFVRTGVVHAFRRFPFLDPELPDELMVRQAPRREATAVFHAAYDRLESAAQRYFDSRVGQAMPADAVA
jgi:phenylacetic acid degradation operon negative regulatory protein